MVQEKQDPMKDTMAKGAKTFYRIFLIVFGVFILASLIFFAIVHSQAKSLIKKIEDPDNQEVVTLASALPLACSLAEFSTKEEQFEELLDFIDTIKDKKEECSSSLRSALACYQDAEEAAGNPVNWLDSIEKGKRLYSAQDELKKFLRKVTKRIKSIETYDEHTTGLRNELASFSAYLQKQTGVINLVLHGKQLEAMLEEKGNKIINGENYEQVVVNLVEKYPEVANFIALPDILKQLSAIYAIVAFDDFLQKDHLEDILNRSQVYRQSRESGCLTDEKVEFLNSKFEEWMNEDENS